MYLQCIHVNKLNIYMQTLHPGVKVYLLCVHMFLKTLGQNSSWILHAWTANCVYMSPSADPEGGYRGSGPPPPWDLSEVGSCVEAWWVGEGVQRLFLPYYFLFFLARFARQYIIQIYYMYTYFHVQCSVWNGHPFSIFPYPNNFPPLAFMKEHFHIFLV